MSFAMSDLLLVFALVGWYGIGWLMGRRYQLLKGFGKDSRVGHAPDWLVFLCGMRGKSENLHLPYAMAQVAAIFGLVISIVFVIMLPGDNLRRYLLTYTTAVPFLSLALGHAIMSIKKVLRRPER